MAVITGKAGNDTLTGTIDPDTIRGLAGNDRITGGTGNDLALMGAGNDTFIWHAGDGDDTLRGGDGFDTLGFEASGLADSVLIAPNASRVGVLGPFGSLALDLDDVERIFVRALAGSDGIFIDNLAGTDVKQVVVDLAAAPGDTKGDGEVDGVVRNGGAGSDIFNVALASSVVSITGSSPEVTIRNADANDILEINSLAGNDTINASKLPAFMRLTLDGGVGNDTITGSAGNDTLDGGDGNDVITGGRGNDVADLGAGNDVFAWSQGHGMDTVNGGDGIDTLLVTAAKDDNQIEIWANAGSVKVLEYVNGGGLLLGEIDADDVERIRVRALAGRDTIYVRNLSGTDVSAVDIDFAATAAGTQPDANIDAVNIVETAGDDVVQVAWSGSKIVVNGLPATVSIAHAGANDIINIGNGAGDDLYDASSLPAGKALLHFVANSGNDTVFGSAGNDRVTVLGLATALAYLNAGNDIFMGGQANDVAHMGAGNDLFDAGDGNDIGFLGAGNDTMRGGAGNDLAYLGDGDDSYLWLAGGGNDTVDGGSGIDTFLYRDANAGPPNDGFIIQAEAGHVRFSRLGGEVISLSAVERLRVMVGGGSDVIALNNLFGTGMKLVVIDLAGSPGSVTGDGSLDYVDLISGAGSELITFAKTAGGGVSITGLAAQVTVTHLDAIDRISLVSSGGNDTINATAMPDTINGASFSGADGNDIILGGACADVLDGGNGNDTLSGGANLDNLFGYAGNDRLLGGASRDQLFGGADSDYLDGGLGNDTLDGGLGNDVLVGGRGNDEITCGDGADRIRYTSVLDGHDVILDFDGDPTGGQDVLDLDALFDSLGIAASKRAALVNINDLGSTVEISVNADGKAGFELLVATLNTADVITKGQDVFVGT